MAQSDSQSEEIENLKAKLRELMERHASTLKHIEISEVINELQRLGELNYRLLGEKIAQTDKDLRQYALERSENARNISIGVVGFVVAITVLFSNIGIKQVAQEAVKDIVTLQAIETAKADADAELTLVKNISSAIQETAATAEVVFEKRVGDAIEAAEAAAATIKSELEAAKVISGQMAEIKGGLIPEINQLNTEILRGIMNAHGTSLRIVTDQTCASENPWRSCDGVLCPSSQRNAAILKVDTKSAGFTATPVYLAAISGKHSWENNISSVNDPTPTSFSVVVKNNYFMDTFVGANSEANGWCVDWVAIGAR